MCRRRCSRWYSASWLQLALERVGLDDVERRRRGEDAGEPEPRLSQQRSVLLLGSFLASEQDHHLEFAGKDGQYLGDETVNVSGNGHSVSVRCGGPWVLMKLPAGTYHVSTDVAEAGHKDVTVHVPGHVIVRFPGAGGAVG